MATSPENIERLKRLAMITVPAVLGALAVRNIREVSHTKHVSYWEASQSFIIDLIEDGREKAIRLSGKVQHGPGGQNDIADIELSETFSFDDEAVEKLESAFLPPAENKE